MATDHNSTQQKPQGVRFLPADSHHKNHLRFFEVGESLNLDAYRKDHLDGQPIHHAEVVHSKCLLFDHHSGSGHDNGRFVVLASRSCSDTDQDGNVTTQEDDRKVFTHEAHSSRSSRSSRSSSSSSSSSSTTTTSITHRVHFADYTRFRVLGKDDDVVSLAFIDNCGANTGSPNSKSTISSSGRKYSLRVGVGNTLSHSSTANNTDNNFITLESFHPDSCNRFRLVCTMGRRPRMESFPLTLVETITGYSVDVGQLEIARESGGAEGPLSCRIVPSRDGGQDSCPPKLLQCKKTNPFSVLPCVYQSFHVVLRKRPAFMEAGVAAVWKKREAEAEMSRTRKIEEEAARAKALRRETARSKAVDDAEEEEWRQSQARAGQQPQQQQGASGDNHDDDLELELAARKARDNAIKAIKLAAIKLEEVDRIERARSRRRSIGSRPPEGQTLYDRLEKEDSVIMSNPGNLARARTQQSDNSFSARLARKRQRSLDNQNDKARPRTSSDAHTRNAQHRLSMDTKEKRNPLDSERRRWSTTCYAHTDGAQRP